MYRYFLDGRQFDEPLEWEKWEETTSRDKEINGLLTTVDVDVEFYGKAYLYLYKIKQQDGINGRSLLEVDEWNGFGYNRIYRGTIFSASIEFNRTRRIAKASVEDDSYNARINNNRNVAGVISSGKSKNGVVIDLPEAYMVDLRSVDANVSLGRSVYCVRLFEMFKSLTAFMSDGEVDFYSETMDTGPLQGACISKGIKLYSLDVDTYTTADNDPMPEITFLEALNNVNRKWPIGIVMERVGDRPRMRIEELSWFYSSNQSHEAKNLLDLVESTDQARLYAKILFGSEVTNDDSLYPFPEGITFFGFKEEEIPVEGIGNIDSSLDLRTSWIVSSNVIQLLTEDPFADYDGEYDENVVLLETVWTSNTVGYTLNQNYLNLTPAKYFFNKAFTNDEVASRWIDKNGIPNSILKFIFPDTLGYLFKAKLGVDQTYNATANDVFNPAGFDTEIFDARNAYNNVTFRYTADRGGLYSFRANFRITISAQIGSPAIFWRIVLRHYDSTGSEKTNINSNDTNLYIPNYTGTGGIQYFSMALISTFDLGGRVRTLNMAKDDYCEIYVEKALGGAGDVDYTIQEENTYFECTDAIVSGDYSNSGDEIKYLATLCKFDKALSKDDYKKIMSKQTELIAASDAFGNKTKGWIEKMVHNRLTSETKFILITNQETT